MCVKARVYSWFMETAMCLAKPPMGGVAKDAKVANASPLLLLHRN